MKKIVVAVLAIVAVASVALWLARQPAELADEAPTASAQASPKRIVSTSPSVTGILLAMDAPLVASAATTPSRISDAKGFFTQWAEVADQRGVQVLYKNLVFDLEAVVGRAPDLLVVSATGADSVLPHQAELQAQGIDTVVVNYANHSWQELARQLGQASGLQAQAEAAIERFDAYAAQAAARITPPAGAVSVVGYNLGGSYSVARLDSPMRSCWQLSGSRWPACRKGCKGRSSAAPTWTSSPVKTSRRPSPATRCSCWAAATPTCRRFSPTRCWPTCRRWCTSGCMHWAPVRFASTTTPGAR